MDLAEWNCIETIYSAISSTPFTYNDWTMKWPD